STRAAGPRAQRPPSLRTHLSRRRSLSRVPVGEPTLTFTTRGRPSGTRTGTAGVQWSGVASGGPRTIRLGRFALGDEGARAATASRRDRPFAERPPALLRS